MYELTDTICAIATPPVPPGDLGASIIRISGSAAFAAVARFFSPRGPFDRCANIPGRIQLDDDLKCDARLYCFGAPRSYTGEDLAELHFFAAAPLVEYTLEKLCRTLRLAGPGEFTLRAYLNGKIDLSQAEAVAQIVSAANTVQLNAARKLLTGKLADTAAGLHTRILDILSLVEAGLDFAEEDIQFVTPDQASRTVDRIRQDIRNLLDRAVVNEEMIDLPSVGLAGASNAGKSSLLNALLGHQRSIVSPRRATTRDVLTGLLELENSRSMLFDCAGLEPESAYLLDKLARQAAINAIAAADIVLFCVDLDKEDYRPDLRLSKSIPRTSHVVATKADRLDAADLRQKSARLQKLFGSEPLITSAHTRAGLDQLKTFIDRKTLDLTSAAGQLADRIAINQRHRQLANAAVDNLAHAAEHIRTENNEIAAMLLRSACENLAGLEKEDLDEQILQRIFSNFCIGK